MIDCLRSVGKVKLRVAAPQVGLGLVLMMLHQVTVVIAASLGCTRMLRLDCLGETRLILHVPSSVMSWKAFQ